MSFKYFNKVAIVTFTLSLSLLTSGVSLAQQSNRTSSREAFCSAFLSGFKSKWGLALKAELATLAPEAELHDVVLTIYRPMNAKLGAARGTPQNIVDQMRDLGASTVEPRVDPFGKDPRAATFDLVVSGSKAAIEKIERNNWVLFVNKLSEETTRKPVAQYRVIVHDDHPHHELTEAVHHFLYQAQYNGTVIADYEMLGEKTIYDITGPVETIEALKAMADDKNDHRLIREVSDPRGRPRPPEFYMSQKISVNPLHEIEKKEKKEYFLN